MSEESKVYIVEDDQEVRESICCHLSSKGLNVSAFPSAESYLERYDEHGAGCLVLDMKLPGMSGLDLIRRLQAFDYPPPFIVLTGFADVPMTVEAIQGGADCFLLKPAAPDELHQHVLDAIERDRANRRLRRRQEEITRQYELLTPREQEVLQHLATGQSSKQVAFHLGLSPRTVEVHRQHIMRKMAATSLVKLCIDLTRFDIIGAAVGCVRNAKPE